jgi:hypothetical protein
VAAATATTIPGIGQLSCNPGRDMLSTKQGRGDDDATAGIYRPENGQRGHGFLWHFWLIKYCSIVTTAALFW